jgi:hypothetical protein
MGSWTRPRIRPPSLCLSRAPSAPRDSCSEATRLVAGRRVACDPGWDRVRRVAKVERQSPAGWGSPRKGTGTEISRDKGTGSVETLMNHSRGVGRHCTAPAIVTWSAAPACEYTPYCRYLNNTTEHDSGYLLPRSPTSANPHPDTAASCLAVGFSQFGFSQIPLLRFLQRLHTLSPTERASTQRRQRRAAGTWL